MLKKISAILVLLAACAINSSAQQVVNGSQVFSPSGWVGTQIPNAASTGTTLNKIAKFTGTGTAVITTTSDQSSNLIIGIVGSGAGTTGNAGVAQFGQVPCLFDGATTALHFVIPSGSTGGDCSDGGSTLPAFRVVGIVLSTNASGGTYSVLVFNNIGPVTIASGSTALNTNPISSNACDTVVTTSAPGVLATDTIVSTPNADISGVTGYTGTNGILTIYPYPTSGNVNWHVCNWTANPVTPGAVTLNWSVRRP